MNRKQMFGNSSPRTEHASPTKRFLSCACARLFLPFYHSPMDSAICEYKERTPCTERHVTPITYHLFSHSSIGWLVVGSQWNTLKVSVRREHLLWCGRCCSDERGGLSATALPLVKELPQQSAAPPTRPPRREEDHR